MHYKWKSYDVWFLTDKIFCHFEPFFALLHPNNPKNQTFEKMKKTSGDSIILQKYTRNHDMLHCYLRNNMRWDGWILGYFLPFYPPNDQKSQTYIIFFCPHCRFSPYFLDFLKRYDIRLFWPKPRQSWLLFRWQEK